MRIKFTFSHRIMASFIIMAILSISIGYLAFVTTRNLQRSSTAIMKENVSSLKAAEELELALLNQKGLVGSYFLDSNPAWLKTLEEKKRDFDIWLKNARTVALTNEEKRLIQDIQGLYKTYDNLRNKAIRLYQAGNVPDAKKLLLNGVRNSIDLVYAKCEDLILVNEMLITKAEVSSRKSTINMTIIIWIIILGTLCLGSLMGFFTARKINEELVRSAKMASLGQLSATVAHEVRNPLTSIKMRLYALQENLKENPLFSEDLSVISEEISRIENIIKNFLDFAKPSELNLEKCDIIQIFKNLINLLEPKAHSQKIRIQKNVKGNLPELKIDREQIRQAFLNIMLNAIEAMPNGGLLELEVFINSSGQRSDKMLEIHFKDTGEGIEPNVKSKLFEPFITTKEYGSGLGLFIASRIIKMHNGVIRLDSRAGVGTTVIVKLPVSFRNEIGHG